jgi:hypothetical protein
MSGCLCRLHSALKVQSQELCGMGVFWRTAPWDSKLQGWLFRVSNLFSCNAYSAPRIANVTPVLYPPSLDGVSLGMVGSGSD